VFAQETQPRQDDRDSSFQLPPLPFSPQPSFQQEPYLPEPTVNNPFYLSDDVQQQYSQEEDFPAPQQGSAAPQHAAQHTCEICWKTFIRACDLNHHLKYHTRPFKCPFSPPCANPGFGLKKDLTRHINEMHPNDTTETFFCPVQTCKRAEGNGKGWSRKDNFMRHLEAKHPDLQA